jgi:hypothetical protein
MEAIDWILEKARTELLDWWRGPQQNPMEQGIKSTVEALLKSAH